MTLFKDGSVGKVCLCFMEVFFKCLVLLFTFTLLFIFIWHFYSRHKIVLNAIAENKAIRRGIVNASDMKMYREIFYDSWIYQLATLINFIITLAIFPAATVLVEPGTKTG